MQATPTTAAPRWLAAAPVLFLLLWSSGFVFLKLGLAYSDPLTFLALRYACVIGLLILPFLWLRPALPATPREWRNLAVTGLLLQAGYFSFVYLSLKSGLSSGGIALVTSQQPILVALLAPVLVGERVGLRRWIGLLLGVAGACIVLLSKSADDMGATTGGIVFAILALAVITASTLWEKRHGKDTHPLTANLVQYGVGLAVTLPLALALEPMHVEWTGALFGSLLFLVVANSIVAISLLLAMIRHGEASRVSALFFMVPPVTAVIAWLVLGETIPPLGWAGMALAAWGIRMVMGQPGETGSRRVAGQQGDSR